MQDDALMATATPREAIMFSANMRMPPNTSKEKLVALVDKLLEDLGLTVCADVIIGGALIKGISGGQRKRTSVGVEVVSNPDVSEPLSALQTFIARTNFAPFHSSAVVLGRAYHWTGLSLCFQSDPSVEGRCCQELRHPLYHPPAFFGSVCTL